MLHFLSHRVEESGSDAFSQSIHDSMFGATLARTVCLTLLTVCIAFLSSSRAQQPFVTSRGDNARDGANTNETLLTTARVNKSSFGKLFTFPVDYVVMAQPLYMPNVNIGGVSHNVVYVATEADSVYAIDADSGAQLWYASMLNGGTTASGSTFLPCGGGPGFLQEGITGTPVIDPSTNTIYLVAKTLLGTTVRHHLHALDITTGNEQPGSPVLITATSTSRKGHVTHFNSLHQKNRPGLLLINGVLYLGFGSNYCNDSNTGWVLSYDATNLTQLGVFNTSPDYGLTSIWQSGNGLAADDAYVPAPNIFASTAEAGGNGFDVLSGGQTYCMSVLKLAPDITADPVDYFTPANVAFLNSHDLDLSSSGPIVLPDQNGPFPHELVVTGKYGVAFVLNRDNLGTYSAGDSNALQEIVLVPQNNTSPIDVMMSSPAYWNNTVYFVPNGTPIMAFPVSAGLLGTPLQTPAKYTGAHSPSISANGNTNGILWLISNGQLLAFDAVSLKLLYGTAQAPNGRDALPALGHFATQTVANGKVFIGTRNSLVTYGLILAANVTGGNGQTATVATKLPLPIQVQIADPYTGQPDVGVTVNFSDGGKGGSFNPPSAVTDSSGNVSTIYTLPKKSGTYTLTISGTGFGSGTATATATPGPAIKIISWAGMAQTGAAGSNLAKSIVAKAQDAYSNGVAGVTVNFTANHGATPNPPSAITDATGLARTTLQLPTTVSTITVTGSCAQYILTCAGFKNITFTEFSVAGPAANIAVTGGNNQSGPAGTQLPVPLTTLVTDQYGNPVPSAGVTFDDGGAGGNFGNQNPVLTSTSGTASQFYTLPSSPGTVTIHAAVTGVTNPAVFTETGQ
jgi:hypothetical protein